MTTASTSRKVLLQLATTVYSTINVMSNLGPCPIWAENTSVSDKPLRGARVCKVWRVCCCWCRPPPRRSVASSEATKEVQVESTVISFSHSKFETGCFQARVELAPTSPPRCRSAASACRPRVVVAQALKQKNEAQVESDRYI